MPLLNPFSSEAFSMVSLTVGINKIPNMFGRVSQLGLMPFVPVATTTVAVEEVNGVLNLLPTKERGAPSTLGETAKRKVRTFPIPHIPHDDTVMPEDVQNLRAFGSENALEAQSTFMAQKLATMRNKHAITLEHLRMGALKGIILDHDGSTLFNLYTEFGITPKTVDFVLDTDSTDVLLKCHEVKRHIELNLKGEVMTGFHALCSPEYFDALVTHPKVEAAYNRWRDSELLRGEFAGGDVRRGFPFGGITWEEYLGQAFDVDGTTVRKFIAVNEAHVFPLGTSETFRTYLAPADFNETSNTLGMELYAKQEPRKFERGWDLHTQSNPLPMCHRPEVLVKVTI